MMMLYVRSAFVILMVEPQPNPPANLSPSSQSTPFKASPNHRPSSFPNSALFPQYKQILEEWKPRHERPQQLHYNKTIAEARRPREPPFDKLKHDHFSNLAIIMQSWWNSDPLRHEFYAPEHRNTAYYSLPENGFMIRVNSLHEWRTK